ncbi:MAG TPA: Mov34/MPN/PAD-1 family protein [Gemmataceae bacterium]|nr:Mov34/MPN/PAD-1 family protein [Gemmataceae bacterium]
MLQGLASKARRFFSELNKSFIRVPAPGTWAQPQASPLPPRHLPLNGVVLTDGVGRTLFEEYADHVSGPRRELETGWIILGVRNEEQATVLATLPAGSLSDAGSGHVQFNSSGQAIGSRIVRQSDRKVTILGVVHTHPGTLRHPSDGDFRGDSEWVGQLRGKEGIFGIGTADSKPADGTAIAHQPRPHVQCLGKLRLSWYSLREGDRHYRPLPVRLTLGPDLARPLHPLWSLIEGHADQLDRLCRQQAGVVFESVSSEQGPALAVSIPLAEAGGSIKVILGEKQVQYCLLQRGEMYLVDPQESRIDRAIYLLLAELAAKVE